MVSDFDIEFMPLSRINKGKINMDDVRPEAAGLLIGIEYSRIRDSS